MERIKLTIIWQLPEQEGKGREYDRSGKSTPMAILFKEKWVCRTGHTHAGRCDVIILRALFVQYGREP